VLHGTAIVFGWLMSAQAIGGIAGSLLITQLSKLISPRLLIPLCGLTFGSLLVVIAVVPVLAIILPLIAVIGMTAIGFFVSQITLLQSNVSNEYQGRIFGAFNTLQAISMLFGMILASGLGDKIGIVPMIVIDAACNILAALLAFVLIRPQLIKSSTTQKDEGTTSQPLSDAAPVSETMPA
ncbi:MAG TPA: MFS transporter, partial [Ktedonobacteraceae bacterium]|nr:MFS transporter [Ktedonobacteraceae bacterium]